MTATLARKEPESLGERLKKLRETAGFSRAEIARDIQAPSRFVEALEEDSYELFPAKVYALGFLKKFLHVLSVEEAEKYLREFNNEWEVRMYHKNPAIPLKSAQSSKVYITPRRLSIIIGAVFLSTIMLFLGVRLVNFISAPGIKLLEPANETVLKEPLTRIRGKTEKESLLTVNGREITIDSDGNFDEKIELVSGLNALEFLAKDRFGKESKVIRYVLVK